MPDSANSAETGLGLAKGSRKVVFGSVVEIANLKSWSNEELVDLAFVAHGAAATAHQAWRGVLKGGNNPYPGGLAKEKPAVTAVLQVDNTAYIATSGRGGPYLYDPPEVEDGHRKHKNLRPDKWPNREDEDHPCNAGTETLPANGAPVANPPTVHRALRNCQLQSLSDVGHRTGGSCAEQFAALSFCSTSSPQSLVGGRIIAIHTRGTETYIIPPCYNPDKEQLVSLHETHWVQSF